MSINISKERRTNNQMIASVKRMLNDARQCYAGKVEPENVRFVLHVLARLNLSRPDFEEQSESAVLEAGIHQNMVWLIGQVTSPQGRSGFAEAETYAIEAVYDVRDSIREMTETHSIEQCKQKANDLCGAIKDAFKSPTQLSLMKITGMALMSLWILESVAEKIALEQSKVVL